MLANTVLFIPAQYVCYPFGPLNILLRRYEMEIIGTQITAVNVSLHSK